MIDRERAIRALRAEVERQNQYYGLDNWSYAEVVDFVLRESGAVDVDLPQTMEAHKK